MAFTLWGHRQLDFCMYHLPLSAFLLLAFLAFLPGVHGQEESEVESLRQRLTEARELHVQFQEEKLQLEREKASLERELASLRKQYATLLLENDKNAQFQTELDLAAIHLIKGAENGELGEGDAARMVELLGHCLARLREVEKIGAALEDTIVAALDASGASQALREPVEKSLAAFRESLEAALSEIGLASTPDAEASSGSCAILRLDNVTQIAILDQGSLHGIRLGQEFTLRRDGQVLARLKVVQLRPRHAAAALTSGDFQSLAYGALLHKEAE